MITHTQTQAERTSKRNHLRGNCILEICRQ